MEILAIAADRVPLTILAQVVRVDVRAIIFALTDGSIATAQRLLFLGAAIFPPRLDPLLQFISHIV